MENENYYILMADIVSSGKSLQQQLMHNFQEVTNHVSEEHSSQFLSPITITLGDEFQSVVKSVGSALQIIFSIEELAILKQSGFKLRYVLMEGEIDTPINKKIAYGMLGGGLTKARKALQELKSSRNRYYFELKNEKVSKALNDGFLVYQSLTDDWKINKDHDLISKFLTLKDYKSVASRLGKTRSQIWKREKSLKISEYIAIKEVIHYIGS